MVRILLENDLHVSVDFLVDSAVGQLPEAARGSDLRYDMDISLEQATGIVTDLATLRRRFGQAGQGCTLKDLVDMATGLNLSARPLRAPLEAVNRLQTPCILHWDMDHFVVLRATSRLNSHRCNQNHRCVRFPS